MKRTANIFTVILLLSSSCSTLNISEIRNLDKTEFDSTRLVPGRETNYLRINIIRQTYEERVNDSTTETKNTPYHPIGFDLGNGLFYDLNENLCLRIDYLLNFSPDKNFELQKITRPGRNKGITIYRNNNDSLTVSYPPRERIYYKYHRTVNNDSSSYMYKNRMKYAIIVTDKSMVYSGKKRRWDVIYKLDENQYYLNKRKRRENYQKIENDIFLENDYIVSLTNNNLTFEIKRKGKGRRKTRVLYTIEKNEDKIFIYNKKYCGRKIVLDKNNILIYRDQTLKTKYELK